MVNLNLEFMAQNASNRLSRDVKYADIVTMSNSRVWEVRTLEGKAFPAMVLFISPRRASAIYELTGRFKSNRYVLGHIAQVNGQWQLPVLFVKNNDARNVAKQVLDAYPYDKHIRGLDNLYLRPHLLKQLHAAIIKKAKQKLTEKMNINLNHVVTMIDGGIANAISKYTDHMKFIINVIKFLSGTNKKKNLPRNIAAGRITRSIRSHDKNVSYSITRPLLIIKPFRLDNSIRDPIIKILIQIYSSPQNIPDGAIYETYVGTHVLQNGIVFHDAPRWIHDIGAVPILKLVAVHMTTMSNGSPVIPTHSTALQTALQPILNNDDRITKFIRKHNLETSTSYANCIYWILIRYTCLDAYRRNEYTLVNKVKSYIGDILYNFQAWMQHFLGFDLPLIENTGLISSPANKDGDADYIAFIPYLSCTKSPIKCLSDSYQQHHKILSSILGKEVGIFTDANISHEDPEMVKRLTSPISSSGNEYIGGSLLHGLLSVPQFTKRLRNSKDVRFVPYKNDRFDIGNGIVNAKTPNQYIKTTTNIVLGSEHPQIKKSPKIHISSFPAGLPRMVYGITDKKKVTTAMVFEMALHVAGKELVTRNETGSRLAFTNAVRVKIFMDRREIDFSPHLQKFVLAYILVERDRLFDGEHLVTGWVDRLFYTLRLSNTDNNRIDNKIVSANEYVRDVLKNIDNVKTILNGTFFEHLALYLSIRQRKSIIHAIKHRAKLIRSGVFHRRQNNKVEKGIVNGLDVYIGKKIGNPSMNFIHPFYSYYAYLLHTNQNANANMMLRAAKEIRDLEPLKFIQWLDRYIRSQNIWTFKNSIDESKRNQFSPIIEISTTGLLTSIWVNEGLFRGEYAKMNHQRPIVRRYRASVLVRSVEEVDMIQNVYSN